MKKFLLLGCLILLTTVSANAAENLRPRFDGINPPPKPPHEKMSKEDMAKREAAFEQKLGLTEEQKAQAKKLREQSFEKIKPLMDEIRTKREEAKKITLTDMDSNKQQEQLSKKQAEIRELEKQARQIKHENMKNFEAILTPEQQKTLKDMKANAKKDFNNKKKPDFHKNIRK